MATRITMTTSPMRRNRPSDRDHGPLPRQLATTKQATAPTRSRRKGLGSVVCMAVDGEGGGPGPPGQRMHGSARATEPLTLRPASAAIGTMPPRRAARPGSPPRRPAARDLPRTPCVPPRWSGRALPPQTASAPAASSLHPRSSWWTSSRCLRSAGSLRMQPEMVVFEDDTDPADPGADATAPVGGPVTAVGEVAGGDVVVTPLPDPLPPAPALPPPPALPPAPARRRHRRDPGAGLGERGGGRHRRLRRARDRPGRGPGSASPPRRSAPPLTVCCAGPTSA